MLLKRRFTKLRLLFGSTLSITIKTHQFPPLPALSIRVLCFYSQTEEKTGSHRIHNYTAYWLSGYTHNYHIRHRTKLSFQTLHKTKNYTQLLYQALHNYYTGHHTKLLYYAPHTTIISGTAQNYYIKHYTQLNLKGPCLLINFFFIKEAYGPPEY